MQRRRRLCQTLDNGRYLGHYKDEQEINTEDQIDNAPGFSILIKVQGLRVLERKETKDINLRRYQDIKLAGGDTMTSYWTIQLWV